jgi:hypothetical protein
MQTPTTPGSRFRQCSERRDQQPLFILRNDENRGAARMLPAEVTAQLLSSNTRMTQCPPAASIENIKREADATADL